MRWRRDNRQQPDDSPDLPAEEWLSQFRPVRPDALTSADRDAIAQPAGQPPHARGRRDRPNAPAQTIDDPRDARSDPADRGLDGSHGRQGRNDDSWARAAAGPAGGSLEYEDRGPESATQRAQPARPDAVSRETGRRAAPGWESGSGQFAPGWETDSGQYLPGWATNSRQRAPGGVRRPDRPDPNRRDDGHRGGPLDDAASQRTSGDGYRPLAERYRPLGDGQRTAPDGGRPGGDSNRPASDSSRPGSDRQRAASDSGRPGGMDGQGPRLSGERTSEVPGTDRPRSAYGDGRASDSRLAGPDADYQSRDRRGHGSELASDVDPRRSARDDRRGALDPARDVHRPAYGDDGGSAGDRNPRRPAYGNDAGFPGGRDSRRPAYGTDDRSAGGRDSRRPANDTGEGAAGRRDPQRSAYGTGGGSAASADSWRSARGNDGGSAGSRDSGRRDYEGGGDRDGYRHGRQSPEADPGEFRPDARGAAGAVEFARDLPSPPPGRDGFRHERPGIEPGAGQHRPDARGPAPERDEQRPGLGRTPADRGGFRTDWEVLRAVRDGLRADVDALRSENEGNLGRNGIRNDPPPRDVGDGRPVTLGGLRAPEQDSSALRSGVLQERADELSGPEAIGRGRWDGAGAGSGPVPSMVHPPEKPDTLDDDTLTRPLPVILPGATALPRPGPVEAPRGPFEPARPSLPQPRPASITGSVDPPAETFASARPSSEPPPRPIPQAAAAKLDQIKDLYLTAEAIGEDALGKHFDQVSQRQRELIREFFERSGPGTDGRSPA